MVIFGVGFGQNKTPDWSLMSCGWVIGYIYVSLYYVSLQVNNIRSIFQIWVGDESDGVWIDDQIYDVNFNGFGERVIFG